jgi:hypothetical protein
MTDTSNSADVIDIRSVIERFEELESKREALDTAQEALTELLADPSHTQGDLDAARELREGAEDDFGGDEQEEFAALKSLLEDLEGNGGDHDWRGSWYPLLLVRDDHFEDFARQEAEDLGLINNDARWPATCIDWEQAADELKTDYTTTEYDGVTYWYR